MNKRDRKIAERLERAVNFAYVALNDRNPNRQAQVGGALKDACDLCITLRDPEYPPPMERDWSTLI